MVGRTWILETRHRIKVVLPLWLVFATFLIKQVSQLDVLVILAFNVFDMLYNLIMVCNIFPLFSFSWFLEVKDLKFDKTDVLLALFAVFEDFSVPVPLIYFDF